MFNWKGLLWIFLALSSTILVYPVEGTSEICGKRIIPKENPNDPYTTQKGEWPSMCAIFNPNPITEPVIRNTNLEIEEDIPDVFPNFVGSGTLIAPGIVLTGALKVYREKDPSQLRVVCDIWDLQKKSPFEKVVDFVSIHPQFNSDTRSIAHNIALLHFNTNFNLENSSYTMCLPSSKKVLEEIDPKGCISTGFGIFNDKSRGEVKVQNHLKKLNLTLVKREDCEPEYKRVKDDFFALDESLICANKTLDGNIVRDGGGPLICPYANDPNRFIQVGIATAWLKSAPNLPLVYESIASDLCAIQWMTECRERRKFQNQIQFEGCKNDWAETEKKKLEEEKNKLEDELKLLKEGDYRRRKPTLDISTLTKSINNFNEMIKSCQKSSRV